MSRTGATLGEFIFAFLMGSVAAVGVAIVAFLAVSFLGSQLLTGEGAAWAGISLGMPAALVAGGAAFFFVARWVLRYGRSSSKED